MLRLLVVGTMAMAAGWIPAVATAPPAAACSCAVSTDQEAVDNADAVFTGTLIDRDAPGLFFGSGGPARYVFAVDEVYEGEVTARQTVLTPPDGASCGFELSGAGPFLVFAFSDSEITSAAGDGELHSHLCSGTRPLAAGGLSVELASSPPIPIEQDVSAVEGGSTTRLLAPVGGVGVLAVLAVAFVLTRRSRSAHPRS